MIFQCVPELNEKKRTNGDFEANDEVESMWLRYLGC